MWYIQAIDKEVFAVPEITFTEVQQHVKELAALIPDNEFYK